MEDLIQASSIKRNLIQSLSTKRNREITLGHAGRNVTRHDYPSKNVKGFDTMDYQGWTMRVATQSKRSRRKISGEGLLISLWPWPWSSMTRSMGMEGKICQPYPWTMIKITEFPADYHQRTFHIMMKLIWHGRKSSLHYTKKSNYQWWIHRNWDPKAETSLHLISSNS